jgi:hypothetical protein
VHGTRRAGPTGSGRWRPGPAGWGSEVDIVKELNTQASRIGTIVGILLAATTFTVGTSNGPIRDLLLSGFQNIGNIRIVPFVVLVFAVMALGWYLIQATIVVLAGMDPAIPNDEASRKAWHELIQRKRQYCGRGARYVFAAITALILIWVSSLAVPASPQPGVDDSTSSRMFEWLLVLLALVVVCVRVIPLQVSMRILEAGLSEVGLMALIQWGWRKTRDPKHRHSPTC